MPGSRGTEQAPGWGGHAQVAVGPLAEPSREAGRRAVLVTEIRVVGSQRTGTVVTGDPQTGTAWWQKDKIGED